MLSNLVNETLGPDKIASDHLQRRRDGRTLGSHLRALAALLRDNPVFEKDSAMALRSLALPLIVAGAGVGAWLVAVLVHGVAEPSATQLAGWHHLDPSGAAMLAGIAGVILAVETMLFPALASSAVAGERERGTLPLLLVSALSPARIVAGKFGGLLVASLPVLFACVPALALASIYGGVDAVDLIVVVVVLAVHGASLAALGVGASSLVKRSRAAAPLAMLFAVAPSLLAGVPIITTLVGISEGESVLGFAPVLAVGVFAELLLAAAALLLARDQISPQSAPRWPARRVVVAGVLVALPIFASVALSALALAFPDGQTNSNMREGIAVAVFLQVGVLACATAAFEICLSDRRAADRRRPLLQALLVAALGTAGLALGRAAFSLFAVPVPPTPYFELSFADLTAAGVGVLALYMLFASTFAAMVSSLVRPPAARLAIVFASLATLFIAPFIMREMRWALGLDGWPLGFTNPAILLDVIQESARGNIFTYDGLSLLWAGLAFLVVGSGVFAGVAGAIGRRRG